MHSPTTINVLNGAAGGYHQLSILTSPVTQEFTAQEKEVFQLIGYSTSMVHMNKTKKPLYSYFETLGTLKNQAPLV